MRRRERHDKQLPLDFGPAAETEEKGEVTPVEPASAPAPKPAPIVTRPAPAELLPVIKLEVYLRLCGRKWDQVAGFRSWALLHKLGPQTVPNWKATHAEFDARPV